MGAVSRVNTARLKRKDRFQKLESKSRWDPVEVPNGTNERDTPRIESISYCEAKAAKRAAKAAAKAEAAAAKHAAKAAERAASSGKELKTKLPSKHDAGALAVQALAEGGSGVGLSPEALATAVLRKALGKNKSRRYDAKAVGLALVKKLTKSKKGKRASTGGRRSRSRPSR